MRIIPAIDLFNGECVRLREGDFATRRVYSPDPLRVAERFRTAGARWLHVVDLEGARAEHIVNWPALTALLSLSDISVQTGGGVRTPEEVSKLLVLGAKRIIVGSIAIRTPEVFAGWAKQFGPEKFCIAVDVKDGALVSNAWQSKETVSLDEVVLRMKELGVATFLCTDVARDGTLSGPNVSLYRTLVDKFPACEWLASGGVRAQDHLTALKETGVAGVVLGKALYEGTLDIDQLSSFRFQV